MVSLKYVSLVVMLFQNAITPIITRFATTSAAAADRYSTPVAVLTSEVLKLTLSLLLIIVEEGYSVVAAFRVVNNQIILKPKDTLRLAVPAILYFIQNIFIQLASGNLPAAIFQVTYQGKTLVVAFCSVLLLQKQLSRVKWLAISLMATGIAIVQLSSSKEGKQSSMANDAEQNIYVGLSFVFLGCLCSGFAGVYFEMMMKNVGTNVDKAEKQPSMWVRNAQLASFTIAFGIFSLIGGEFGRDGLYHGFNSSVWFMVVNNAVGGLCVAFVIKYADNILKGFACALATAVAAIMAVPLFGFELNFSFFVGMLVVVGSTLLYGGAVSLNGEWWNKEPEFCKGVRTGSAGGYKKLPEEA
eukprot:CAMPEP_0204841050 /NCGR_PEP_ID=MMETSP1346-20131115/40352_1 /ASSEMBLY_ACC=CAM_ASM_000771 /TAXON_ID=215587 /ORGANISM="Aplanochytrium stocchinoi, Strain GSBS06" /LENGTH=355 /DNA_ID=CAMNT_0051978907 /DNA_START=214 /DNA_END=1284 /DNA_ORIENTATION=+